MKRKKILAACLIAVLVAFGGWLPPVVAVNNGSERLEGVVRILVVEDIGKTPSFQQIYVEQCNGKACDYENLKEGAQIDFVFLKPDKGIDLNTLVNKKVILRGRTEDFSDLKISTLNKTFVVTGIEHEEELPQPQNLIVPNIAPINVGEPSKFNKNVVVLPTTVSTNPIMPHTEQQFRQLMFGEGRSARKFFEAVSWHGPGNQGFTILGVGNNPNGDVAPNYQLTGIPTGNCLNDIIGPLRVERDTAGTTQGFPIVSGQTRIHVYANIPGCSQITVGTVGIFGNNTITNYIFIVLPVNSTQADLDGLLPAIIHEIEHNLGQGAHADGQQVPGGPITPNGDKGDPLASNVSAFNSNAYRLKFGWFLNHQVYPVIRYRGTYRVKLQTPAISTKGVGPNSPPMAAFIESRDMNGVLTGWVEMLESARIPTGLWDHFTPENQAYAKGLAIRGIAINFQDPNTGTIIRDTTPATVCCKDAPLVPGPSGSATWTNSLLGQTFIAYTATRTGMWVEITLGPNYPLDPSLVRAGIGGEFSSKSLLSLF